MLLCRLLPLSSHFWSFCCQEIPTFYSMLFLHKPFASPDITHCKSSDLDNILCFSCHGSYLVTAPRPLLLHTEVGITAALSRFTFYKLGIEGSGGTLPSVRYSWCFWQWRRVRKSCPWDAVWSFMPVSSCWLWSLLI